jgi:hypothetical protein
MLGEMRRLRITMLLVVTINIIISMKQIIRKSVENHRESFHF